MRLVVLGVLTSLVFVVSSAHAATDAAGFVPQRRSGEAGHTARGVTAEHRGGSTERQTRSKKLVLDEPVIPQAATSSTVETVKSLANGDSLINPWVPGRGAIGVNVKVTW
jgi:hypothetical protein